MLEGNVGLLFTNEEPKVVTEWFESFARADFARSGNKVNEEFALPAGTPLSFLSTSLLGLHHLHHHSIHLQNPR